jgi:hypothetical protein
VNADTDGADRTARTSDLENFIVYDLRLFQVAASNMSFIKVKVSVRFGCVIRGEMKNIAFADGSPHHAPLRWFEPRVY